MAKASTFRTSTGRYRVRARSDRGSRQARNTAAGEARAGGSACLRPSADGLLHRGAQWLAQTERSSIFERRGLHHFAVFLDGPTDFWIWKQRKHGLGGPAQRYAFVRYHLGRLMRIGCASIWSISCSSVRQICGGRARQRRAFFSEAGHVLRFPWPRCHDARAYDGRGEERISDYLCEQASGQIKCWH
jgi:hypothetical protein